MNLFQLGDFTSHSGKVLSYKIDCDALSDEDIKCLAFIASQKLRPFSSVVSVHKGGDRLGDALDKYRTDGSGCVLIVDDVLTTGKSMQDMATAVLSSFSDVQGVVIFARGPCPGWITALFQM